MKTFGRLVVAALGICGITHTALSAPKSATKLNATATQTNGSDSKDQNSEAPSAPVVE